MTLVAKSQVTSMLADGRESFRQLDCMNILLAKYQPDTVVNFYNGGIDIVCADSIDARGDLNLNGIANEIADAVMYTQYFLYGLDALDANPLFREAQIAASDVNPTALRCRSVTWCTC